MASTPLRLRQYGYEIHYVNLSDGCCGGTVHGPQESTRVRAEESRRDAQLFGGIFPVVSRMIWRSSMTKRC
jgi:hypothetical protein